MDYMHTEPEGNGRQHAEIIRHAPTGWKAAQQESSGNKIVFRQ